jgi:CRISPR-associated protein Cas2
VVGVSRVSDYAVVYDISADAERSRVDKVLKGFGFRVQKSVFECRMDRKGKSDLIRKLEGLGIKTGFVKVYRLEYSWNGKIIGQEGKKNPDGGHAFIV